MKDMSEWNDKAEIETYKLDKKDALETFEDLQDTQVNIENEDPGYISRLTAKIIDNIQVYIYIYIILISINIWIDTHSSCLYKN